jgi:hypothetical protein
MGNFSAGNICLACDGEQAVASRGVFRCAEHQLTDFLSGANSDWCSAYAWRQVAGRDLDGTIEPISAEHEDIDHFGAATA